MSLFIFMHSFSCIILLHLPIVFCIDITAPLCKFRIFSHLLFSCEVLVFEPFFVCADILAIWVVFTQTSRWFSQYPYPRPISMWIYHHYDNYWWITRAAATLTLPPPPRFRHRCRHTATKLPLPPWPCCRQAAANVAAAAAFTADAIAFVFIVIVVAAAALPVAVVVFLEAAGVVAAVFLEAAAAVTATGVAAAAAASLAAVGVAPFHFPGTTVQGMYLTSNTVVGVGYSTILYEVGTWLKIPTRRGGMGLKLNNSAATGGPVWTCRISLGDVF